MGLIQLVSGYSIVFTTLSLSVRVLSLNFILRLHYTAISIRRMEQSVANDLFNVYLDNAYCFLGVEWVAHGRRCRHFQSQLNDSVVVFR